MHNILISNVGFGQAAPEFLAKLKNMAKVCLNEEGIKFSEAEFISKVSDTTILIAGTEKISRRVFEHAKNLKLIARVGSGVDNIDLDYAKERKIKISYTPFAPSEAVPEFTVSLILNLIKNISLSDRKMHKAEWYRPMGRMLSSLSIGIVGVGKIGTRVIELIKALSPNSNIYYYDPNVTVLKDAIKCDLDFLFQECDVISLHLPLNEKTKGLINGDLLFSMKKNTFIVNTSRGGIMDEEALYQLLKSKHLTGAALDVFEVEPYQGSLNQLDNCLLTSHMGSLTQEVRAIMEAEVVEDVIRFINNEPLLRTLEGFNFCE